MHPDSLESIAHCVTTETDHGVNADKPMWLPYKHHELTDAYISQTGKLSEVAGA